VREFYELVVDCGALRSTSLTLIKETARAWARQGLVTSLEIYHVEDPCEGKDEKRIKLLTAWKHHSGWASMGSTEASNWDIFPAPSGAEGPRCGDPTPQIDLSQKEKK
jgi:hypothetical protein